MTPVAASAATERARPGETIDKKEKRKTVEYQDSVIRKASPLADPDPLLQQQQDTISS